MIAPAVRPLFRSVASALLWTALVLAASAASGAGEPTMSSFSSPAPTAVDTAGGVSEGLALIEQRRLAEAQAVFEALLTREPGNLEATYQLGVLALRRGEADAAVQFLEKALSLAPDAARTHHNLGHAYGLSAARASVFSKLGFARKCLASYQRAVELAPQQVEYRLSLIRYYQAAPGLAGGGTEKALAAAEEVRTLDPIRGSLTLIGIYVSAKQWPAAFTELSRLREQSPALREADYQFGRLASLSGLHIDEGISALNRFLAAPAAPGDTPPAQALFRLGTLKEKAGRSDEARSAYREALAFDPNHQPSREAAARLDGQAPAA